MATGRAETTAGAGAGALAGVRRFEMVYSALSCWLAGGFYLDAWAHNNRGDLETFFTPWHAVLYSGFLVLIGWTVAWRVVHGTLPRGYRLSLIGAQIFFVAGVGDALWHEILGIETGVEALLSPTHLGLAAGTFLLVAGPLRAADREPAGPRQALPMVLSLAFSLSVLSYMTAFAHPLVESWPARDLQDSFGRSADISLAVSAIILQSALLSGALLLGLLRRALPVGSLLIVIGLNGVLTIVSAPRDDIVSPRALIAAVLAAGVAAELLRRLLRPAAEHLLQLRAFASAVPLTLTALTLLAVELAGGGIWWSVHVWSGAIVLAGVSGLLVSFLLVPPESLDARAAR